MQSFTVTGNLHLDYHIHHDMHHIANEVRTHCDEQQIDCLALGGGYGRGEGGVREIGGEQRPYNDYDLVLIHHCPNQHKLEHILEKIHQQESARCGLHVDITPIHRDRVPHLPPALTWYEFGRGHRVIWGDERALRPLQLRKLSGVHHSEWGRLLVNRGMGLWFAQTVRNTGTCPVLDGEDPTAFITRQIMKAWLAYGDCQLADAGLYNHHVLMRQSVFEANFSLNKQWWAAAYRAAIAFKLNPTSTIPDWIMQQTPGLIAGFINELKQRTAAPSVSPAGLYRTLTSCPPPHLATHLPRPTPTRSPPSLASRLIGRQQPNLRTPLGPSRSTSSSLGPIWLNVHYE